MLRPEESSSHSFLTLALWGRCWCEKQSLRLATHLDLTVGKRYSVPTGKCYSVPTVCWTYHSEQGREVKPVRGLCSSKSNRCNTDCHLLLWEFFLSLIYLAVSHCQSVISNFTGSGGFCRENIRCSGRVIVCGPLPEELVALNLASDPFRLRTVHSQSEKHHLTNVLHITISLPNVKYDF